MPLGQDEERGALAAVAALTNCNPFVPERVELEKRILGSAFKPFAPVWYAEGEAGVFVEPRPPKEQPNGIASLPRGQIIKDRP